MADQEDQCTPEQRVEHLAEKFERHFGTKNVSAASKLLWLLRRHPYVIYDSRASFAIFKLSGDKISSDYHQYYSSWRRLYLDRQKEVGAASLRLLEIDAHVKRWRSSPIKLSSLVKETWFQERVFDIYLWELGESRPPAP